MLKYNFANLGVRIENPLAEEFENIDMLSKDMKRIFFLKATRDGLTKMVSNNFVTENMRDRSQAQPNDVMKKAELSPHKLFHKEDHYLRIINTKKIDLAILRNEVDELIETVVNHRVKNKEMNEKLKTSEALNASVSSKNIGFKNKEKPKQSAKNLSPEEKQRIIEQLAL